MDNRKVIVAFYLFVSGIIWLYARAIIQYATINFYQFKKLQNIVIIKDIFPIAAALITFVILLKHSRVNTLMEEVVTELKKVTWPGREEVSRSTTVVMVCIAVASFILAFFDLVWGKVIGYLLS